VTLGKVGCIFSGKVKKKWVEYAGEGADRSSELVELNVECGKVMSEKESRKRIYGLLVL
jgi:hypothetical protein